MPVLQSTPALPLRSKSAKKGPAPPTVLTRSRFAHLFRKNGRACVLHSMTRQMLFGEEVLAALFEAFATPLSVASAVASFSGQGISAKMLEEAIDALKEKGLLIGSADEDVLVCKSFFHGGLLQNQIHHMYLLTTSECNLRCRYCFVEDNRHVQPCHMSETTAAEAIQAFARLARGYDEYSSVVIYGGEPLLNARTTLFAIRRLRQLEREGEFPHGLTITLLTNGTLIDEKIVEELKEARPLVAVSIDGPRHLHDASRKDGRGQGSFDGALRGFRLLQQAGLDPSVSCTINEFTLHHMDEVVDFIVKDLGAHALGFNVLMPRVCAASQTPEFDHEFAAHELIRAFEKLRRAGIYEDRVMRRVKPFVNGHFHFKDCMGVGGQIVVSPSGRIGPCQAMLGLDDEKYFPSLGQQLSNAGQALRSEMVYADPLFDEWRHRYPLNMSDCVDCFAISICGGGCPYAAILTRGSIWQIDERICFQAKNILEWMIWDTCANMDESSDEASSIEKAKGD